MAQDRILLGLGLRLAAILCLTLMAALAKVAGSMGTSLMEIIFFRQLLAIPVVVAWVAMSPGGLATLRTDRLGAHAWRTVAGLVGMIANFSAVLLLPLAEATTLQFTVPIFATLLGIVLLGERVGKYRWGAVLAGLAGVLVVAQPSGDHFPLAGTLIGLFGAFMIALIAILLRQLGRTESAGTTVFWFSLFTLVPLGPVYLFYAQPHGWQVWALLAGVGFAGGIGQIAITAALRYAPVSAVVPMDYSGLIWATIYGWLLFGVLPTSTTWFGAPLIIAAGLVIVWRERVRARDSIAIAS